MIKTKDENQTEMDFETDAEETDASEGELSRIASLVDQYEHAEADVYDAEQRLKEAKQKRDQLSGVDIPSAMDEVGLSEVRLADGRPVRVESGVRASIPKKYEDQAFNWLESNGYGDLIKAELVTRAGRGELAYLRDLADSIESRYGYSNALKQTVHPQTLSAFVRERREEGESLPEDLLGVFEYRKTKVG